MPKPRLSEAQKGVRETKIGRGELCRALKPGRSPMNKGANFNSAPKWRLAKMNLAVRGIDADIRWNNEGSFHKDELKDLRFDYILANPPFNISDWGGERLREDARWTYGAPPVGNANYAWLQHILWHLAPNGTAGVVLANGSMSSAQSGEDVIRKGMVEADVIDCIIALPGQLFYSVQIPACLWFLGRNKKGCDELRDRRGEVLFIDARKLGAMVDRTRKEFSDGDIAKIAGAYHAWREGKGYEDVPGFCKAAKLDEIKGHWKAIIGLICWKAYRLNPRTVTVTAPTANRRLMVLECKGLSHQARRIFPPLWPPKLPKDLVCSNHQ